MFRAAISAVDQNVHRENVTKRRHIAGLSSGHVTLPSHRVAAKVEWHQGELFPRVGFIVTNLGGGAAGVTWFYNGRGTAEQWIKEGKNAVKWTRLSCHDFAGRQKRWETEKVASINIDDSGSFR